MLQHCATSGVSTDALPLTPFNRTVTKAGVWFFAYESEVPPGVTVVFLTAEPWYFSRFLQGGCL